MNAQVIYAPGQGDYDVYAINGLPVATSPYVYTYRPPVRCGPIQDPYCPDRQGIVGLPDTMGYPTCCCPTSGRCHTATVAPIGDPPRAIVAWPFGPFAYMPRQINPPFY